jgi:hypothetical protein
MFSAGVYNSTAQSTHTPLPESDDFNSPNVTTYADSLGISLRQFLDIATDEAIDFTRPDPREHVSVKIRRHASPLTHPWNCLDKADFVGRFEHFEEDFQKIAQHLGITKKLPHLHRTIRGGWRQHMAPAETEIAMRFYREDFERLSY